MKKLLSVTVAILTIASMSPAYAAREGRDAVDTGKKSERDFKAREDKKEDQKNAEIDKKLGKDGIAKTIERLSKDLDSAFDDYQKAVEESKGVKAGAVTEAQATQVKSGMNELIEAMGSLDIGNAHDLDTVKRLTSLVTASTLTIQGDFKAGGADATAEIMTKVGEAVKGLDKQSITVDKIKEAIDTAIGKEKMDKIAENCKG